MQNKDLQQAIEKFQTMLDTYPDSKQSVHEFRNFLRHFLRLKATDQPLPTVEIMSILKVQKPNVFQFLKQQGKTDTVLGMLTETSVSLEVAEARLDEYVQSL
ncbi:hypothetical protein D7Z54_27260 [Salibacterium salarium]|uniref:Uncharacterized protein n=1 Tax=Salibacterium salarium TaxID=284579 RepID=A0A428MVK2_9BACI|nr:hypothetical protein [Salibacterium salarium]RSL30193.1 hypothetical protein D7Z54_27260 [Salibacterium salarium]